MRLDHNGERRMGLRISLFNSLTFARSLCYDETDIGLKHERMSFKSESVWKPHALYLMAEYYFSKNQKQKSKEFFEQIITLENISSKIKVEAQKRLRADFSE